MHEEASNDSHCQKSRFNVFYEKYKLAYTTNQIDITQKSKQLTPNDADYEICWICDMLRQNLMLYFRVMIRYFLENWNNDWSKKGFYILLKISLLEIPGPYRHRFLKRKKKVKV